MFPPSAVSGTSLSPLTLAEFCAGILGIVIFWRKNNEVEKLRRALNETEDQDDPQLQSQATKISELNSELVTLTSKYESARQRLVSELKASQVEVNSQSGLIASLRQNLQLAHAEVQAKNRVTISLEAELEKLKNEERIAHSNVQRLSSELESSKTEVNRQSGLVRSLEKNLEQALADAQTKSQLVKDLETKLNHAQKHQAARRHAESDLALAREEVARQSQSITSLRQELDTSLADVLSKTDMASGLEKELAATKRDEAALRLQVESLQSEVSRHSGLVDSLRGDLTIALSDLHEKTMAANELETEVGVLRREGESNRALGSQLEASQLEVTHQSALIASLRQDLEKEHASVNAKGELVSELERQLAVVKQNCAELEERLASELESSRGEMARHSDLAEGLRLDLEHARSDVQNKTEEVTKVKSENMQLHDEISALKERAAVRESQLEEMNLVSVELENVSEELRLEKDKVRLAEQSKSVIEAEMAGRLEELRVLKEAAAEREDVKASQDVLLIDEMRTRMEEIENGKRSVEKELEKKIEETDSKTLRLEEIETVLFNMREEMKTKDSTIEGLRIEVKKLGEVERASSLLTLEGTAASPPRPISFHQRSSESLRTGHTHAGPFSRVGRAFDSALHLGKREEHEHHHTHERKSSFGSHYDDDSINEKERKKKGRKSDLIARLTKS